MLKAGKEAESEPSLTLITMFEKTPDPVGVPESLPVDTLKVAQLGLFWTLKEIVSPFGSAAEGRKL